MSRSQRTPSRAPSTASNSNNNDMANNNAALLGALLAFGGASKSNGDILRSRGNSPATPASSLRGRPPALSPSPSYRQPATAPATARVSPAAAAATRTNATARDDSHDDLKTQRPTPPPKPRRLSEHHYKPRPISPTTSFIGILEKNTLRRPTLKQQHHPNEVSSVGMEVRAQAEAATTQIEGFEGRQKDPAHHPKGEVFSSNSRPTPSADRRVQDRTRAQVKARLAEAQDRARSQALSSSEDDEYVSASEDTARSPTVGPKAGTTAAVKQPSQPSPARSRPPPPPGTRRNLNNPSQPIEISPAPRASISSARSVSPQSNPSLNAAYHQLYPRRTTNLTLGEDLANAMVASSLATSRASSPSKLAPPSTSSRRHSHLSPFRSRTPSPTKKAKGMRQTLRDPESSSSESETEQHPYGKHKKKRHLRPKHPNKHHEGMSQLRYCNT